MSLNEPTADDPTLIVEPGWIKVVESGEGKFAEHLRDGRHLLVADEPASAGGNDRGPGPYELLLMALGACTTMTLRLYADRKGWPLARTRVRLCHRRIHANDCADCETKLGVLDRIELVIELEEPLNDPQRQRLLEIANMCPVHRTFTSEINVDNRLGALDRASKCYAGFSESAAGVTCAALNRAFTGRGPPGTSRSKRDVDSEPDRFRNVQRSLQDFGARSRALCSINIPGA